MNKPEPCNHGRKVCMECHGQKGDFKTLPEMYDVLAADNQRLREALAKAIYEQWKDDPEYVPWIDGGNSHKQTEARKLAALAGSK